MNPVVVDALGAGHPLARHLNDFLTDHGATSSLTAFQSFCSEYNDHPTGGVRSASGMPYDFSASR